MRLFGEMTFPLHAVRASVNLKLCSLSDECIQNLMRQHFTIRNHLYQKAVYSQEKLRKFDNNPLKAVPQLPSNPPQQHHPKKITKAYSATPTINFSLS